MVIDRSKLKYVPGTYAKKRPDAAQIARLANILDVEETEAEKLLHQIDQEQHASNPMRCSGVHQFAREATHGIEWDDGDC